MGTKQGCGKCTNLMHASLDSTAAAGEQGLSNEGRPLKTKHILDFFTQWLKVRKLEAYAFLGISYYD